MGTKDNGTEEKMTNLDYCIGIDEAIDNVESLKKYCMDDTVDNIKWLQKNLSEIKEWLDKHNISGCDVVESRVNALYKRFISPINCNIENISVILSELGDVPEADIFYKSFEKYCDSACESTYKLVNILNAEYCQYYADLLTDFHASYLISKVICS